MAIKDTPYRYMTVHGLAGYGYLIEHAGKLMHSIAWPDKPGERMMEDELAEHGIRFEPLEPTDATEAEADTEIKAVESTEEPKAVTEETPATEPDPFNFDASDTEANNIRNYIASNPTASNQEVIAALNGFGMEVSAGQVAYNRKRLVELNALGSDASDDQAEDDEAIKDTK